jgi:hypothetical protein
MEIEGNASPSSVSLGNENITRYEDDAIQSERESKARDGDPKDKLWRAMAEADGVSSDELDAAVTGGVSGSVHSGGNNQGNGSSDYAATQPQRRRNEDVNPGNATVADVDRFTQDLTTAFSTIDDLFSRNEISPQQYSMAMERGKQQVITLQEMRLAAQTNELNTKLSTARWHDELSELLPEWSKPSNREHVGNRLKNHLAKFGITESDIVGLPPKAIAYIARMEKLTRPQQKVPANQQKQSERASNQQQTSRNAELGYTTQASQLDQIAKLLGGAR